MESVLAQTYTNWELLVADDNSSDNSREVVEEFIAANSDRRIRLLHNRNGPQGTNTPINMGIRNMAGELFAWLSSDDFYLPEKLERQVELMTSQPELGMVYTSVYTVDDSSSRVGVTSVKEKDHLQLFCDLFERPEVNGSTIMVRKEVFDTIGLLIESHPEMPCIWRVSDHLKWMEIALHYPVAAIEEPIHCTRLHRDNTPFNLQHTGRSLVPPAQAIFFDRYPPEEVLNRLSPNPGLQKRFSSLAAGWFLKHKLFEKAYRYLSLLPPEDVETVLAEQRRADIDHHRLRAAAKLWDIGKADDAVALANISSPMPDQEALDYYTQASRLERHGCRQEARDIFELLLIYRHERPDVVTAGAHFYLGSILSEMGDLQEARHHLSECLSYNKNHRAAKRLLEELATKSKEGAP
jgi:glycosyltransferase involved in cell wall biosynthesis